MLVHYVSPQTTSQHFVLIWIERALLRFSHYI